MEFTRLGRTALKVSKLCLGTMNFGPQTDEAASHEIMDRAHDLGINFFDTANVYGRIGITETIIGNWFAKGGDRRDKTVLATKVFGAMGEWPNESRLSALHIRRSCEASLRRLQTDHIDILQMHHVDRDAPWEEVWQAFETLVAQGKVVYAGSSNFAGWHIAQAQEAARSRHFLGLVSEQSLYNLNARMVELEVVPAALHYGLGIIPWSPLAGGLLGGVLDRELDGRRAGLRDAAEANRPRLEAWEGLCDKWGERPADVALAWLLHQPAVAAPIIGPRTLDQLNESVRSLEIALDQEQLAALDGIFPGPGGTAPEAYAW